MSGKGNPEEDWPGLIFLTIDDHSLYPFPTEHDQLYRGYLCFSVKDRNLFHRVDTIGTIFTSGAATSENIIDGVHEINKLLSPKKKTNIMFISCF